MVYTQRVCRFATNGFPLLAHRKLVSGSVVPFADLGRLRKRTFRNSLANRRCAVLSRSVQRLKGARLSAMLGACSDKAAVYHSVDRNEFAFIFTVEKRAHI